MISSKVIRRLQKPLNFSVARNDSFIAVLSLIIDVRSTPPKKAASSGFLSIKNSFSSVERVNDRPERENKWTTSPANVNYLRDSEKRSKIRDRYPLAMRAATVLLESETERSRRPAQKQATNTALEGTIARFEVGLYCFEAFLSLETWRRTRVFS